MTDINIQQSKSYCKYCRYPLQFPLDQDFGFHTDCYESIDNYNTKKVWEYDDLPKLQQDFILILKRYLSVGEHKKWEGPSSLLILNADEDFPIRNHCIYLIKEHGNLTKIKFACSRHGLIPDSITKITTLTDIEFYRCWLFNFYDILPILPLTLRKLKIENSNLPELPDDIEQFTELEELTTYETFTDYLPDSLGKLKKLKKLSIQDNYVDSLPKSIFKLPYLEELYHEYTNIPTIINIHKKMPQLKIYNYRHLKIPVIRNH